MRTELTRFSFWRTEQWESLLATGWRVRKRSHVRHRCR